MNLKNDLTIKCLLSLGALVLFACSDNPSVAHEGTTEDSNATVLWEYSGSHNRWHLLDDSAVKVSALDGALYGNVTLNDDSNEELLGAGISLDLVNDGEDSKDLSKDPGICITYSSDFDLDLVLDFGEETNAALQYHVPGFHLYATSSKMVTKCKRWDDLMQDKGKYPVGPEVLTDVVSFQLFFYGEPGQKGDFKVSKVTRYKEPVYSYGESGKYSVNETAESLVAKSFLWDETTDGARVKLGSSDPTSGAWFYNVLSDEDWELYYFGSEDVPSETFGFNIVNDKLDGTNVSAWRGLCVSFYSEEDFFKVILDVSGNEDAEEDNSWYVDVEGKAERHWVKIPWESFKPNNPDGESFETAVTHASRIYFEKDADLKLHVYKVGSYDQCGE